MIQDALKKVVERKNLTQDESTAVMGEIMRGEASPALLAALLTALRLKGETAEEIAGFAGEMRAHAHQIKAKNQPVVDTCGTGGDASGSFNVSTVAAFIVAGAGVTVAKHGNRSVSSKCGSADVLEACGAKIDWPPAQAEKCLNEVGVAFLFAPLFHPAMKNVMPVRKELGIRTVFNILGPLTNPAGATGQILGVFKPELTEIMADVLGRLGCKRAFVVHGHDGLDEFTLSDATRVSELNTGQIKTYDVTPEELGLTRAPRETVRGGTAADNAAILKAILSGADKGPRRDVVLMNAAAALVTAGRAADLKSGLAAAQKSIDSGTAHSKLEQFVNFKG